MSTNLNNTPSRPVTESDIEARLRERAAVMELADQLEREARAEWPARRARGYTPPPDNDDDDSPRLAFWLVRAIALTAVLAALVILQLSGCGGGGDDDDDKSAIRPPACIEHPEQCR
jgi:hypothetical protein